MVLKYSDVSETQCCDVEILFTNFLYYFLY